MKAVVITPVAPAPPDEADTTFHSGLPGEAPLELDLKNILVPLDFSDASLKALRYAVPLARAFGATLTLLHIVELPAFAPEFPVHPQFGPEPLHEAERRLEEIRQAEVPDDVCAKLAVRQHFIFEAILETARETEADLIVATTHGSGGLLHLVIGSTAQNIVCHAPCPVLIVR